MCVQYIHTVNERAQPTTARINYTFLSSIPFTHIAIIGPSSELHNEAVACQSQQELYEF